MPANDLEDHVAAIRRFNRSYTKRVGALNDSLLDSPFSLTQSRVLFELGHRDGLTATDLRNELALDPGYLSRVLRGFEKDEILERRQSDDDGRRSVLSLTPKGREASDDLDRRAHDEIASLLATLSPEDHRRLLAAMATIDSLIGDSPDRESRTPYLLRPHQPGDMGWVVHRHGVLYAQEYGWDERFEALVAQIVADFIRNFDPKRERCWMAERDGEIVGSVFLVRGTDEIAKLRLLLVEPSARGLGIGARLVDECLRFARRTGYKRMTLWTQRELVAARRIYQRAGLQMVREEVHNSFGHDLVAETWEIDL
jgi:DNA-binding MarR family transcriptional regulator/GNAT superfamily N-acetyltransferase